MFIFWTNMLVLTPNQRLSRTARQRFNESNTSITVWETPEIFPIQTWLLQLWQKCVQHAFIPPAYLISTTQKKILMRNMIARSHPDLTALHSLAVSAWEIYHQHDPQFKPSEIQFNAKEEIQLFAKWAKRYQTVLADNHWVDAETAILQLMDVLSRGHPKLSLLLPSTITLFAFTDFSKREQNLFELLSLLKVNISEENDNRTPTKTIQTSFNDEESEIEAVAKWAFEQSRKEKKIACVFPDIATQKNKILACFYRYFDNHQEINISLGKPLSQYHLIQSALSACQLLLKKIHLNTASLFLLSPYFALPEPFQSLSRKALLENKLRIDAQLWISSITLLNFIFNQYSLEKNIDSLKTPKEWMDIFQRHLDHLGFLKEVSFNSEESQCANQWQMLMENFALLSVITPKISLETALLTLQQLADQTTFQPKQSPFATVDILGLLESAGQTYDAIWIAGLHELAWPIPSPSNPFLSFSSFSLEDINQRFYLKIKKQLLTSADKIFLSYPQTILHQDTQLSPSHFFDDIPHLQKISCKDFEFLKLIKPSAKISAIKLTQIEDYIAPLYVDNTSRSHGSEIIKDQAACPFRAFAKHRLGAKKFSLPEIGINAKNKGSLIHQILEKIFEQFPDLDRLSEIMADSLKIHIVIEKLITKALISIQSNHDSIFLETEKLRLNQLLLEWLKEYEMTRQPFSVISREEKIHLNLAGLNLHLRIDRIDRIDKLNVENNETPRSIIIDYKTGKTTIKINPLIEPQLALYAIAKKEYPNLSVAIAQIRPHEMRFKPIPAETEEWEAILTQIAKNYMEGIATVEPYQQEESCRYCDLATLCRIKTLAQSPTEDSP